jgi:AAHS family 4-hydroxybenzoate transporter-like MFS transporter
MPAIAFKYPYLMALTGFLVAMVDGYDTLMLAFIAPLIAKEWALAPQVVGTIFASSFAGAAIGATSIGIAADRYGRKAMLLASLALAGTFTLMSAWSETAIQLMALRAAAGLGLGGALSTITALTAESAAPEKRRSAVTRMFLGFPIGAIVGGIATASAMTFLGWRGVFVGGGACALSLIPLVFSGVGESATASARVLAQVHSKRPLAELISNHRGLATALFCVCVFLMLLTSYFLVNWVSTVLTLNGVTPKHAAMAAVVLNVGGIVGTLILSFLFSRRRPLVPVMGCLYLGALMIGLLGHQIMAPGSLRFILIFVVGLLIIGAQGGIPALCVHLYPPSVHATAVGLSVACGRLGSILGPLIGGYLISAGLGWQRLFLVAALPALSAGIAMAALAANRKKYAEPAVAGLASRLTTAAHASRQD